MLKPINRLAMIGVLTASLGLQSCWTTEEWDAATESVARALERTCKYLPNLFSLAAFLNAPGAPQGEKAVEVICAAVNKARAEKAEEVEKTKTKATSLSLTAGPRTPSRLPAGIPLDVTVNGRTVTGLTTK
ncbi:hypothetical protein EFD56_27845 [Rhizobium phaseoli]|uniref:hypothetical protein n=1 Tax=Rhizobium phaseoli TaxID=396 RepID=UPI000F88E2C1|nr:hypothetical protein [Rhizobium phaseoli]RUM13472.1 hypothetical protein EFD56_27845 [Rhizobium phaseoli]